METQVPLVMRILLSELCRVNCIFPDLRGGEFFSLQTVSGRNGQLFALLPAISCQIYPLKVKASMYLPQVMLSSQAGTRAHTPHVEDAVHSG